MSKWWSIGIIIGVFLIDIALFYYVPNGLLITLATLPYIFWWTMFSKKSHLLFIPIVFLVIIFVFFVLPFLDPAAAGNDIIFFVRMYQLIYPGGWSYAWVQLQPSYLMESLLIVVGFVFWVKFVFYVGNKLSKKISKKNFMLMLSQAITTVLLIYTLLNLIPCLFPDNRVFLWFKDFFATSIFYDICFVWFPFVVLYFMLEWVINEVTGRN